MGGPRSPAEVEPFLVNLFSDRELIQLPGGAWLQPALARLIAKLRAPKVRRRYAAIGGGSPLGRITANQAELLQERLGEHGDFVVEVAMRYTAPRVDGALMRLRQHGVSRCVVLPLYPQYSRATTGSSLADLDRALDELGLTREWEVIRVRDFHDNPLYLDALAERVGTALDQLAAGAEVVFSAHSLPQRLVDQGDPYRDQVEATVAGLVQRLGLDRWHLGYQSRSGPVRWLEPDVLDLIATLASRGARKLLVVPVSFVSDHIETLHEIDVQMREHAQGCGVQEFARSPSLNEDPTFIEALAQIVLDVDVCQNRPQT